MWSKTSALLCAALTCAACGRNEPRVLERLEIDGGTAPADVCGPTIVSGLRSARDLAVFRGRVYWIGLSDDGSRESLMSTDLCGARFVNAGTDVAFVAEQGTDLVWSDENRVHVESASRLSIEVLIDDVARTAAVDDTHVYWSNGGRGGIKRKPRDGMGSATTIAFEGSTIVQVDGSFVYYVVQEGRARPYLVRSRKVGGSEAELLFVSGGDGVEFFGRGRNIYAVEYSCTVASPRGCNQQELVPNEYDSGITRIDTAVGTPERLVWVDGYVTDIEALGDTLYFATTTGVWRLRPDDGEPARIVQDPRGGMVSIAIELGVLFYASTALNGDSTPAAYVARVPL